VANDAVAEKAKDLAVAVWHGIGCRDAGRVDIRADANAVPNFLEVNPLPGLHPQHSDLPIIATLVGLPYRSLLESILDSAFARVQGSEYIEDLSAYMRR
jgi:D-alanine-D-alanine ligase